jgi:membrane protein implicated in regulation of membrane protease activity
MEEYFLTNLWLFWAVVSVVALIVELSTGGFFVICFAFGAVISAVSAALGVNFYWQLFIFALCSALAIFLVRPFIVRYAHGRGTPERVSNADAIIGREGFVSEAIVDNGFGRVAIDGDDWKAVSSDGASIGKGEKVRVSSRDSIIITVQKV